MGVNAVDSAAALIYTESDSVANRAWERCKTKDGRALQRPAWRTTRGFCQGDKRVAADFSRSCEGDPSHRIDGKSTHLHKEETRDYVGAGFLQASVFGEAARHPRCSPLTSNHLRVQKTNRLRDWQKSSRDIAKMIRKEPQGCNMKTFYDEATPNLIWV